MEIDEGGSFTPVIEGAGECGAKIQGDFEEQVAETGERAKTKEREVPIVSKVEPGVQQQDRSRPRTAGLLRPPHSNLPPVPLTLIPYFLFPPLLLIPIINLSYIQTNSNQLQYPYNPPFFFIPPHQATFFFFPLFLKSPLPLFSA